MRVTFDLQLPRSCKGVKKMIIRQALRYLIESDLCFFLNDNDKSHCSVKQIKIYDDDKR